MEKRIFNARLQRAADRRAMTVAVDDTLLQRHEPAAVADIQQADQARQRRLVVLDLRQREVRRATGIRTRSIRDANHLTVQRDRPSRPVLLHSRCEPDQPTEVRPPPAHREERHARALAVEGSGNLATQSPALDHKGQRVEERHEEAVENPSRSAGRANGSSRPGERATQPEQSRTMGRVDSQQAENVEREERAGDALHPQAALMMRTAAS